MSDACEREQRDEKCASPKTASSTPSMTLASTALESQSQSQNTTQQQHDLSMASGSGSSSSTGQPAPAAAAPGRPQSEQQQQQQQEQLVRLNEQDMQELREIEHLLWGASVREDVFKRWSQGFEFSDVEPSALVQKQGGPCAVIAPVQAYLLKIIIMDMPGIQLSKLTSDKCQKLLIEALCNILKNCRAPRYKIVTLQRRLTKERRLTPPTADAAIETAIEADEGFSTITGIDDAGTDGAGAPRLAAIPIAGDGGAGGPGGGGGGGGPGGPGSSHNASNRLSWELTPDEFHERLHSLHFDNIADVARHYLENYSQLSHTYGVLLFMYSVFLTKGAEQVTADISDLSEPLIHSTYGYGAQSLINLMLTGRAVAHVWDNEQDVGGLKLRGICEQSDIGFITLMEQMRYCTVGSFFKNPRYPVWVMGSDTHLTVLFSNERRLVSPETPSETGRRIFKSYDPEGNNFISSTLLRDVLAALNLVSEPGYVNLMQKRLDPENLGIILLNGFMDEFFPLERRSTPDTFDLFHYNGIPGSNDNNRVRYYCGTAILLEGDLKSICTSNPMVTCLQTKWPNIEVNWHESYLPSLN